MSVRQMLLAGLMCVSMACTGGANEDATLKGRITEQPGTQSQALRTPGDTFGGMGTVSEASNVKVSTVGSDGKLTVVGEAKITSEGSYELKVPPSSKKLIVQAFDASDKIVASAIVEASAAAGQTSTCAPLDTESSVEAEVFVEMVAQGVALAEANAIDLRARIDTATAVAVRASVSSDAKARVRALAEAIAAAQRTEVKAYAQAGVETSQSALFDGELAAAQALNVALDAKSDVAEAYAAFLLELDRAAQKAGATAKKRAQAESSAGLSFRATMKARLSADPVSDAAIRMAAALEARASSAAVEAILEAGNATTDVQAAAAAAGAKLRADVKASTSLAATASAYAAYSASVRGEADISGSALGNYLGVTLVTKASAQAAVDASISAAATLDASLSAAISAGLKATGAIDFDAIAAAVAQSYTAYSSSVEGQASSMTAFGASAAPAVDVLLVTQGSFRIGG